MADYHLMAELIVPEGNAADFEKEVATFVSKEKGGFRSIDPEFDSELVLGLKSTEPFPYKCYGAPQGSPKAVSTQDSEALRSVYRYVNVWRLLGKDELDLARVMTLSADNDLYNRINSLVTREFQNFVLRVQWLKGRLPQPDLKHFVRVTRQFTTRNLGTYLFKVGTTFPFLETQGWFSLGHYQAITGALNTVTELWQTKDGSHEPESMLRALQGLPAGLQDHVVKDLFGLHYAEIRESFMPAPYTLSTVPTGVWARTGENRA